jgi:hypothetical protein
MLLTTTTELTMLALVLIAGWLFGLASHSGGGKWKARYLAERDAHAGYRRDADARIAAAETRHRDMERDHARLAQAAPVTTVAASPSAAPVVRHAAATPTHDGVQPATVIRPNRGGGERRGWFDFGNR